MHYLLFLALPLLSVSKGIGQSYVSKRSVSSFKDNALLNLLMFFVAAILFAALYIRGLPNLTVFWFSLGFAACQVLFQLTYSLAFKYGSYAVTTTILGFALFIQILVCLIFFNESLTVANYIAFGPLAASIILFSLKNKKEENSVKKNKFKWIIFTILAFVSNAFIVILQIFFKHQPENISTLTGEFCAWSFVLSFVMMLPIFGLSFFASKKPLFKVDLKNSIAIIVAGVTLVLYNFLSTVALNYFPGSIFYPIRNGITVVMNFVADLLFYKSKITVPQWIAASLAIVAIVLLNL